MFTATPKPDVVPAVLSEASLPSVENVTGPGAKSTLLKRLRDLSNAGALYALAGSKSCLLAGCLGIGTLGRAVGHGGWLLGGIIPIAF